MYVIIVYFTPSIKNKDGKRDPKMHQTKKGNQWYRGIKVHIGVDCGTGYVHTITRTATNVHDIAETSKLLREDDKICYGGSGYIGVVKRPEIRNDERFSKVTFRIYWKPSRLNVSKDYQGIDWERKIEHKKTLVKCKIEHVFLIVKRQFRYSKKAYLKIAKSNRFHILFGYADLLMCIRRGRTDVFRSVCFG